jgi:hypothetical protein
MALCGDLAPEQHLVVFTRSFAEITEPFDAVEAALLRSPRTWLPDAEAREAQSGLDGGEMTPSQLGAKP